MDIVAIVGAVVGIATLVVMVGGGFYWWGRLSSRVDALTEEVKTLRGEVQSVRGEVQSVRGEVQSVRSEVQSVRDEMRGEVQSLRGEVQSLRSEILTEIRRSEERILTALAHHSHVSPDAGAPVFRQPIGAANPASPPATEAPAATNSPDGDAPDA